MALIFGSQKWLIWYEITEFRFLAPHLWWCRHRACSRLCCSEQSCSKWPTPGQTCHPADAHFHFWENFMTTGCPAPYSWHPVRHRYIRPMRDFTSATVKSHELSPLCWCAWATVQSLMCSSSFSQKVMALFSSRTFSWLKDRPHVPSFPSPQLPSAAEMSPQVGWVIRLAQEEVREGLTPIIA